MTPIVLRKGLNILMFGWENLPQPKKESLLNLLKEKEGKAAQNQALCIIAGIPCKVIARDTSLVLDFKDGGNAIECIRSWRRYAMIEREDQAKYDNLVKTATFLGTWEYTGGGGHWLSVFCRQFPICQPTEQNKRMLDEVEKLIDAGRPFSEIKAHASRYHGAYIGRVGLASRLLLNRLLENGFYKERFKI